MKSPERTVARVGDAMLWEWGEAVRTGRLEALVDASLMALSDSGSPKAPGTHSDPTAARVLASERHDLAVAMTVDREIRHWRADQHMRLWSDVAHLFYANPQRLDNAGVGRRLSVSERVVDGCRRQMRRILWLAIMRETTIGSV